MNQSKTDAFDRALQMTGIETFEQLASLGHVAMLRYQMACEICRMQEDLDERMTRLSESLRREAEYVRTHARASNGLGVIQSSGLEIDRLCGELNKLRDSFRALSVSMDRDRGAATGSKVTDAVWRFG
jgi:hypothetical protein